MIFLDNASTTKIFEKSLDVYLNASNKYFYNPSALYSAGSNIKQMINQEKQNILSLLGASQFDNLIFTSSATESNNTAIRSFVKTSKKALFGISEHPSVYNVAKDLITNGYNVEFINLNNDGSIDINDYKAKLTKEVNFVSIMHVNNETGAINPIKELVNITKSFNKNIIFHCDGVQAFGKIDVDLSELGVDLYTISSHKICGPKGIGGLYIKKGVNIKPLLLGGGQENNLRSSTENTPAILAFASACAITCEERELNKDKINKINKYLKQELLNMPYDLIINSKENSSPYIISFSLRNLRAETILRMLESKNILIGSGSACSSHKKGNRVLENMGLDTSYIEGSLRVSLSYDTTLDDITTLLNTIREVIDEYKEKTNR